MNCDRIAGPYRWIEYLAFGRTLEKHRYYYLPQTDLCSKALLLGDGDGRFLSALASLHPTLKIDSIDSSGGMLERAEERMKADGVANPGRIRLLKADVRNYWPTPNEYDLVVTNFFFDCFEQTEVADLVQRIAPACQRSARWLVSEFQQPRTGWQAWHARVWLAAMYTFFDLATGLKTRRLPRYQDALQDAGFHLSSSYVSRAGLVCSELWQKNSNQWPPCPFSFPE